MPKITFIEPGGACACATCHVSIASRDPSKCPAQLFNAVSTSSSVFFASPNNIRLFSL